ncbi:hypothetical protein BX600DRAFT_457205 [Xylariales sp. PMI_506]|nr:hypothetical protein BX600DRAFT_457205 [Xylariales sp. PMI_506]
MDQDINSSSSWVSRLGNRLRSKASKGRLKEEGSSQPRGTGKRLRKGNGPTLADARGQNNLDERGERRDYQTGILGGVESQLVDVTDALHSLGVTDFDDAGAAGSSHNILEQNDPASIALRRRLAAQLASLPDKIWHLITLELELADIASLSLAWKFTFRKFARQAFDIISLPEYKLDKVKFLHRLDVRFPLHLLCHHCGIYHVRRQPGLERLMPDYVNHPVFLCPVVRTTVLPRTRVAHGRELPYAFVQLAVRAARFGPAYGIDAADLGRRWRDPDGSGWSHQTRYLVRHGHLLMRVRSQAWIPRANLTPSEMRMILFTRGGEYAAYFSTCAHWRDGVLTRVCKCALSHVPEPPPSAMQRLRSAPAAALKAPPSRVQPGSGSGFALVASQCSFCMPGRRCPECPSEYVAKIIRAEDKDDPVDRFKFALVVLRWCDLGDGSGPLTSPEWAAINGLQDGYPSLEKMKHRALMGSFESALTGVAPHNRVINMNPKNEKKGEAGNDWY